MFLKIIGHVDIHTLILISCNIMIGCTSKEKTYRKSINIGKKWILFLISKSIFHALFFIQNIAPKASLNK